MNRRVLIYAQSTGTVSQAIIKAIQSQSTNRVPGEIKRSRDFRGGRWSWTLKFAQKRS